MAQNIIMGFTGSCPVGWVPVMAFDNKFLRGSVTYGATGGSSTHTHVFSAGSATVNVSGFTKIDSVSAVTNQVFSRSQGHAHTVASEAGIVSGTGDNTPQYVGMVFCSYSEDF